MLQQTLLLKLKFTHNTMEFTEKDLQLIIQALLKLPAEYSFDLLTRIKTSIETKPQEQHKPEE